MNSLQTRLDKLFEGKRKISLRLCDDKNDNSDCEYSSANLEEEDSDLKRAIELSQKALNDTLWSPKESDYQMALRLSQGKLTKKQSLEIRCRKF